MRNHSKQEYHAESQNWSISQGPEGHVFVANNAGLLEYDGVEWSFYPSLGGAVTRTVAVDGDGRIYTGGYRDLGYWERNDLGELIFTSLVPVASHLFSRNEEFWDAVIMDDGVCFRSFNSLFLYEADTFRVIRPDHIIQSVTRWNDRLLVSLSGQGVFMLEADSLVPLIRDAVLEENIVQFLIPLDDNRLLLGTESAGLYLWKDGKMETYFPQWAEYFASHRLNRGCKMDGGRLVLGSLLDGLMVVDSTGSQVARINQQNGLQNNTILGIQGKGNEIWVAMDQGVDYISLDPDPSYTRYEYSKIGAVYSAAVLGDELYLATNQGVFYRDQKAEEEDFRMVPGTQGQAWSCDVFDGQLLVSHNLGAFLVEDHRATRLSRVGGGFSITRNPGRPDMLIQSTYSNIVLYKKEEGRWAYSTQLSGFNDLIRYVEMDHLDQLWASHMHRAIYRLKLNEDQDQILQLTYLGDSIFGKDHDVQVFKIENRIVFTTGDSIFTYDDLEDRIIPHRHLNRHLGSFSLSHRIIPAPDHHYWFISREGIALFHIYGQDIEKIRDYPMELFKEHMIDGYENILPLNATEGLLCLDNGYAILKAEEADHSLAFQSTILSLKRLQISGRSGRAEPLPLGQESLEIPFKRNSLQVLLAFPYYGSQAVRFESMMEGLDPGWTASRDVPVFTYIRMPAGEYTLRIRALNEWNQQSQELHMDLVVLPPWYLNSWSISMYILVSIMLFLLGRYLVLRRIRRNAQIMQDVQEKQLVSLRNEKLNAELSFKSQELATSTMAIIKKNEFLMDLKEVLRAQKDDLGTRYPEKYYNRVIRKIDDNIGSMDDWNVFEIHFERAHEKFLQKITSKYPQLSHSDLRLCAYLRMNLTSKEIAPLMRISYRGVENHRYRLRKKLLLKKDVNLTDFILSI